MDLKYNTDQHLEYFEMIDRVGLGWLEMFQGNTKFYSAAYWDLLTRMWRAQGPVRKTDALGFMTAIKSAHTAGKYVDTVLHEGLIVETDNPADARSKLLDLAPEIRRRFDEFLDTAISEVRKSNHRLNIKGPSPEEP